MHLHTYAQIQCTMFRMEYIQMNRPCAMIDKTTENPKATENKMETICLAVSAADFFDADLWKDFMCFHLPMYVRVHRVLSMRIFTSIRFAVIGSINGCYSHRCAFYAKMKIYICTGDMQTLSMHVNWVIWSRSYLSTAQQFHRAG